MARPSGPKVRCNGQWTEARYRSFITSLLRQGTRRWAPISTVLAEARRSRGNYECAHCKQLVPLSVRDGRKKVKNVFVDHIDPVVDVDTGFTTWDEYIERMFVEKSGLQVLCGDCHTKKTNDERAKAAERRKKEKEEGIEND